jgi:phosphoglycolate phosphatase-like HAD superfamily hydrolase
MPHRVKPVVGLDVDGTLGDYHNHFIKFAEAYCGKEMRRDYDGRVSLAKWCGISKATYRQVKLAYRQGGMKRSMPCYPNARELTVALRKAGAEVVICTTRPYLHLSNIEPDTTHWLRRNGIQHDGLIMGEHKYRQLVREYGAENVVMVLEDLPEQIEVAKALSLPVVLRRGPHNWRHAQAEGMSHVGTLLGARELGLNRIYDWRETQ